LDLAKMARIRTSGEGQGQFVAWEIVMYEDGAERILDSAMEEDEEPEAMVDMLELSAEDEAMVWDAISFLSPARDMIWAPC
jgi:hypothetical protein